MNRNYFEFKIWCKKWHTPGIPASSRTGGLWLKLSTHTSTEFPRRNLNATFAAGLETVDRDLERIFLSGLSARVFESKNLGKSLLPSWLNDTSGLLSKKSNPAQHRNRAGSPTWTKSSSLQLTVEKEKVRTLRNLDITRRPQPPALHGESARAICKSPSFPKPRTKSKGRPRRKPGKHRGYSSCLLQKRSLDDSYSCARNRLGCGKHIVLGFRRNFVSE